MDTKIKQIRRDILNTSFEAGACHIGSALSCVEILVNLYYNILKEGDVFLFSKASGVATFYAILADKGYFAKENLAYYLREYPLANKVVPGVIHSVGSLGHGLPVAVGLALGDRSKNVYCLIGDAEVQEGTFWESILFARQHKLKNLKIMVDKNELQACGKTQDILCIDKALELITQLFPIQIINTVKGAGVREMEHKFEWHYWNLSQEQLDKALKEL